MDRRALLIVNAKSRTGAEALATIEAGLRRRGIEPVHRQCDAREDLSPMIRDEAAGCDCVVVAGGDGTLNAAARGVMEAEKPLGVIPTGTANDLARTLDIPPDIDRALDIVAAGRTRRIDLGSVNDALFFNVASIGLSVELAQRLTGDVKRRFGKLGYVMATIGALSGAKPFHASIVGEGRRLRALTLQIAVGNGRYYGGGNLVEQNAAIDDQRLDLYSLEFTRAWRMILMLRSLRYGEHGSWREIRSMTGDSFEVRTRKPRSVNADGEIVTRTPARFSLLPRALEVFAPEASAT